MDNMKNTPDEGKKLEAPSGVIPERFIKPKREYTAAEVAFACYRGFFEGFGGGFCDVCRLLRQGRLVLHTTKKGFYNAKKTEKNKGLG